MKELLATSLILGCIIFWILIVIATVQMGIAGALIVLGLLAIIFGFMLTLIIAIGNRDEKRRNKNE